VSASCSLNAERQISQPLLYGDTEKGKAGGLKNSGHREKKRNASKMNVRNSVYAIFGIS
jgi:hypothetical protein